MRGRGGVAGRMGAMQEGGSVEERRERSRKEVVAVRKGITERMDR